MADSNFLGRGWSFPPQFHNQDRQVMMVEADEDIRQSLMILLAINPGERIMQPAFGCGLKSLVFDAITESLLTKVKDMVERAVLFYEPRIDLLDTRIDVSYDPDDDMTVYDGVMQIHLDYAIRQTNTRSNLVYPFYFIEGTNVRHQL